MRKGLLLSALVAFMLISAGSAHAKNLSDVNVVLDHLKYDTSWVDAYKADVWDCSNMAACLTWCLSDYETRIVEGKSIAPLGIELPSGDVLEYVLHAKVKILIDDQWYWIEPTNLAIDANFPEYYQVEREFKSYRDAIIAYTKQYSSKIATREYAYDEKYMKQHVWVKPIKSNPRKDWPAWLR